MRGSDEQASGMFSYLSPEQRVRPDHPLRAIRRLTDQVLAQLSPQFTAMYSRIGRPSIPAEQLRRALLIQSLYSIRSERLLMEEIDYSMLYRWFIGLSLNDRIWSPTTFSKNRERLLAPDVAAAFFDAAVTEARAAGLLSDEHFTSTARSSKRGPVSRACSRATRRCSHRPTIRAIPPSISTGSASPIRRIIRPPTRRLFRKGGVGAVLSYLGHVLLDNRHGLVVNTCVTAATGTAEW
jgi:transposase